MRSFGAVALAALSGVVLWQLFTTILLPLLGVVMGVIIATAKLALIAAVVFFIYSLIRRRREQAEGRSR